MSDRSLLQRREALGHANHRRSFKRELIAQMRPQGKRGALVLARVLAEEPELLGGVEIGDMLRRVPRMGKTIARRVLIKHRVHPWHEIERLTERQLALLVGELVSHANGGRRR